MQQVSARIKGLGFNPSNEWLEACVEFCKSQTPNATVDHLVKEVANQWIDTDITVEGTQAGPQIQALAKEVVKGPILQGRFVLQVQKAIDIGQNSAFAQLQTVMKTANENALVSADNDTQRPFTANWEPKSRRMLELTLTDGFNNFSALEFEPLNHLSYPVAPGLKIELRGPITVRRGMMLLQTRNLVKIVGGHVAELENKCSLAQVLSEVLGRQNAQEIFNNQVMPTNNQLQTNVQTNTNNRVPNYDADNFFDDQEDDLFIGMDFSESSVDNQGTRNESQGGRPLPKTAGNLKTQSLSAKKARISTTTTNVWNDTDDDAWLCDEENWIEPDVSEPEFPDDDEIFAAADPVQPVQDSNRMSISARLAKTKQERTIQKVSITTQQSSFSNEIKIEPQSQSKNLWTATTLEIKANIKREPTSQFAPKSDIKKESFESLTGETSEKMTSVQRSAPMFDKASDIARGKPYTYLSLVQKNSNCIEVLKGCIVTLVGKMGIADGLDGKIWTVKVSFTDGSGTVTASLAPKLVEDAFGFSPLGYSHFTPSEKAHKFKSASAKLSSLLSKFNGLVRMRFDESSKDPEILELISLNRGHLQQLKLRINKYF